MNVKMEVYDFGQKEICPKETLDTPFAAMAAYHELQRRVKSLQNFSEIAGRSDHFVKSLDTLRYSCSEVMYQTMVIREAMTGFKTKEEEEIANGERRSR